MRLGLVIMLGDRWDVGPGSAPSYREVRSRALAAEDAGWDSLWVYDHLLYRAKSGSRRGIWEGWTMLSALAEATGRIALGALVMCTQFRNPGLLAKMATTLDEVSQGRFTLGLGAGWNREEFEAFGIPWDRRVDRFEEAIRIIAPLLRDGGVDFEGRYYQARNCELLPRGPTPGGPPIMVGARLPRMLSIAARWADLWNCGYVTDPEDLAVPLATLRSSCLEIGRQPDTIPVTAEVVVWYPDLTPEPGSARHLDASATELWGAVGRFEKAGVDEVMFELSPPTEEAFRRLTASLR